VIKGEDGFYYKLNVTENGDPTVTDKYTKEELQNGLLGDIIVAKSITAEKVAVDDLVAFGATLAGFHIKDIKDAEGNYVTSAIYSGVKQSVDNTTTGVYMDKHGQFAVGDGSNYLKFFKDKDGTYKLAIAASVIRLGGGKTVEEVVEDAANIEIGARNLIRNSTNLIYDDYFFRSPSAIIGTGVLGYITLGEE
jgi:hypothetical protein